MRRRGWLGVTVGPWILRKLGVEYPQRPVVDLVEGDGVSIDVEDDESNEAVRVTISAEAGGATPGGSVGELQAHGPDGALVGVPHITVDENDEIFLTMPNVTDGLFVDPDGIYLSDTGGGYYHIVPGTAGGARNVSMPSLSGNDTFAMLNASQTLTNKTISAADNTIDTDFGSQDVVTTGKMQPGYIGPSGTLSTVGFVRLASGLQVVIGLRNTGNTADLSIIELSAADGLYIGTNSTFTVSKQVPSIQMYATSSGVVAFGRGGTTELYIQGAAIQFALPRIGYVQPYASEGVGTQAMADANQTPASAVYRYAMIQSTGAITANRTLTLPGSTDAAAYEKWIDNTCTGAFSVVVASTSGSGGTVTVANGKKAKVWIDSRGVTRLTADI